MSRLPFELLLALRYLRPKRTFVSVITLISVVGVTLGVAVLIIVISVMSGFDKQLRDKILGFNTHLKVLPRGETMKDYAAVARTVTANPQVKAVAPFILGPVLVQTEPPSGQPQVGAPWIRGIDPLLETNMTILPGSIVEGKFDVSDRGLLVGTEFAQNMNLQVGDLVEIGSPSVLRKWREGSKKENASAPVLPEYEVRGIFDVGYFEYNVSVVVTSLRDAQDLYDLDDGVHGLMVMLHDPYQAPVVELELARALGPKYGIRSWMRENANLLNALIVEKNVMFYLLFFIVIVAALCILSALITFVVQKTREIGMLKALGATDAQVSRIFLSQAAVVGAIGDLAGYGLGMLALRYRNEFLHFMNRMTGFELFPSSIYGFAELPALIFPRDIALICGSAWVICILGGVIPAWRAGRLKPVEALRYE
ncbi:MAG TPA: FtsX-like permease family protein [Candidatus Paceibacterota bacterium]|nr:FtsX-like permease family protein [Verrucomicrobiota bacterium]HSA10816.1 FtsX-like permease family protein [Candidatus Paceibacterota bacterium]